MYHTPIIKILPNFIDLVNGPNLQDYACPNNNYFQSLKYNNILAHFLKNEVI